MAEPDDLRHDGDRVVNELIERTLRQGLPARGRKRWSTVLARHVTPSWVAGAPLALAAFAAFRGIANHERATLESAALLVLCWASFYGQILFHELGHLRAARALGCRVVRVVGGPFAFVPKKGRLRPVQNRDWRYLMMGAVFYAERAEATPRDRLRIAAAGPVYTLLALVGWTLLGRAVSSSSILGALAETNQVMAAYLLVINLVPFRFGDFASDGHQMREALRAS